MPVIWVLYATCTDTERGRTNAVYIKGIRVAVKAALGVLSHSISSGNLSLALTSYCIVQLKYPVSNQREYICIAWYYVWTHCK